MVIRQGKEGERESIPHGSYTINEVVNSHMKTNYKFRKILQTRKQSQKCITLKNPHIKFQSELKEYETEKASYI